MSGMELVSTVIGRVGACLPVVAEDEAVSACFFPVSSSNLGGDEVEGCEGAGFLASPFFSA